MDVNISGIFTLSKVRSTIQKNKTVRFFCLVVLRYRATTQKLSREECLRSSRPAGSAQEAKGWRAEGEERSKSALRSFPVAARTWLRRRAMVWTRRAAQRGRGRREDTHRRRPRREVWARTSPKRTDTPKAAYWRKSKSTNFDTGAAVRGQWAPPRTAKQVSSRSQVLPSTQADPLPEPRSLRLCRFGRVRQRWKRGGRLPSVWQNDH